MMHFNSVKNHLLMSLILMIKTETVLNGANYKVSMQKIYVNYADSLQNKNGRSAIELGLQQQHDNGAYVDA
jgi:hypothetical protein